MNNTHNTLSYSQQEINTLTLSSMRNVKQLVSYVNDAKYSFITSVQQKMSEYSNLSKIVLKSIKVVLDTVVGELNKLEAKQPLPPDYAMVQLVKRHCLKLRDHVVTMIRCAKVELNNVIQEYDLVFQMQNCVATAKNILAAAEKLENFRSVFQIDEVHTIKEESVEEEVHDRIRAFYDEEIDEESYSESLDDIEFDQSFVSPKEYHSQQLEPIMETPTENEDTLVNYLTDILNNSDTPPPQEKTQTKESTTEESPVPMSIKDKIASLELKINTGETKSANEIDDEVKIVISRPKEEISVSEKNDNKENVSSSEKTESESNNDQNIHDSSIMQSDISGEYSDNIKKKFRKSKDKWRSSMGDAGAKLGKIMGKRNSDMSLKKRKKLETSNSTNSLDGIKTDVRKASNSNPEQWNDIRLSAPAEKRDIQISSTRSTFRDLPSLDSNDGKLNEGIEIFNKKWSKGVEFFVFNGFVPEKDDKALGEFLWKNKDKLSKEMLGDLLGGKDDDDIHVLTSFSTFMNFNGLTMEKALRVYLQSFMLPGEAQKISRMMDVFSSVFVEQNPGGGIPDSECAFVLAFAIIMLNTDAHNPAIADKDKMKQESFIKNLSGTWVDGSDPPRDMLVELYHTIVNDEIIMIKEGDPDKRGWLRMSDNEGKRFFHLKGNQLIWYKDVTLDGRGVPVRGKITLNCVQVAPISNENSSKFYIISILPTPIIQTMFEGGKEVIGNHMKLGFTAATRTTMLSWVELLKERVTFEDLALPEPTDKKKKKKGKKR